MSCIFGKSLFNFCNSEGEVDNYVFNDKCTFEFVLFKGGFVIAKRNKEPDFFDFYDPSSDTVITSLGYQRKAKKYIFRKNLFFIYNKSSIIKNFKLN